MGELSERVLMYNLILQNREENVTATDEVHDGTHTVTHPAPQRKSKVGQQYKVDKQRQVKARAVLAQAQSSRDIDALRAAIVDAKASGLLDAEIESAAIILDKE